MVIVASVDAAAAAAIDWYERIWKYDRVGSVKKSTEITSEPRFI